MVESMADLTQYERRGDLEAPFELTKKHERMQRESERMRDVLTCTTPPLTWEQYAAGEPCPGCGHPYQSEEFWESKGTMYFTDEERTRYEAEEARFKRHTRTARPAGTVSRAQSRFTAPSAARGRRSRLRRSRRSAGCSIPS